MYKSYVSYIHTWMFYDYRWSTGTYDKRFIKYTTKSIFEDIKDFAHVVYQNGRNSRIYLSSKLYDGLNHSMTFSAVSVIQNSPIVYKVSIWWYLIKLRSL